MRNGSTALAAAAAALVACTEAQPCPGTLDLCGGVCVDTRRDVDHCGTCGTSCVPGQFCLDGGCVASEQAPCDKRTGGAFVLLGVCGQSVKAWIVDDDFVRGAEALVGGGPGAYPVLDVRDGTDCDAQWTWHVDPDTAAFAAAPPFGCGACPGQIEGEKASWLGATWCPDPVEVLLVERP